MVHEVNNLLQVISGSAEMLGMAPDSPTAVLRRADIIGSQAQRAAGLLSDVLAFSRESPGTERVDLRDMVNRALGMRQYALGRARIEARVDLCLDEAVVRANPRRLLQMVLNLTLRAERAVSGEPGAFVSMSVVNQRGDVVLVVEDNGAEVVPSNDGLAFEVPMPNPNGPTLLGIGLSVADWLATQEGGRLVVSPRAGGGTTAALSFPSA